jgi:diguanylate cyclase (GGDEF)-like protein
VTQRFHAHLADRAIPHAASPVAAILTVSLGVATQVPNRSDSPESLVARADKALYRAKQSGRNCTFVDPQSAAADECATIKATSSV